MAWCPRRRRRPAATAANLRTGSPASIVRHVVFIEDAEVEAPPAQEARAHGGGVAELKRVRHDVHAEPRALADAAETTAETISKAAAHRRAAEEHRADLERARAAAPARGGARRPAAPARRAARGAGGEARETERDYKARLEPVRAENAHDGEGEGARAGMSAGSAAHRRIIVRY